MLLHNVGSNNPVGVAVKLDNFSFMPYFFIKDFTSLIFFFILFSYLVFFAPNLLGHPDNYVPANPLVTPNHIVPEWYFLPFYAILRALPNKTLGVVALLFSIVSLAFLPFYCRLSFRSGSFRPIFQVFFFLFVLVVLILG
jgi:ubiquinol-cytochrome c reductase cytochrome b subunit